MALAIVTIARAEHYLTVGGKQEHLAGIIEEAALFSLFLAAAGLVLLSLFFASRETALRCLHHAVLTLALLACTLVVLLLSGFSIHSWRASLMVPLASLASSFVILLIGAAWHSTRTHQDEL